MTSLRVPHKKIGSGDTFETLHRGLAVALISTQRDDLKTCRLNESLSDVINAIKDHNERERYDYLPVTNDEGDKIVGLFHAVDFVDESSLTGHVKERCCPLLEEHLIGADASILDFIKEADCKPCRLVVSGTRIVGLVTLSDLQKLPVRAALFALITGLEITMFEAIKKKFPTGEGWLDSLSGGRQQKIKDEKEKSKKEDGFVDALLFTQFCDKADILTKSLPFSRRKKELRNIQNLRDSLAHANEYAVTPEDARKVWAVVKSLLKLREEIQDQVLNIATGS